MFDRAARLAAAGAHPAALRLDPAAEQAAKDLAGRERDGCSFFSFTFASADAEVHLAGILREAHMDVLDTLADQRLPDRDVTG